MSTAKDGRTKEGRANRPANRVEEIRRLVALIERRGYRPPGVDAVNAILEATLKQQTGEPLGVVEIHERDLLALLDILAPVFDQATPPARKRGRPKAASA